jgi:SAM-dependent methyltransferase
VLNFVSDRAAAIREFGRVARDDGVVAAYVWDYPGEMQLMKYFWDAAGALDPAARDLDEGLRFEFCQPDPLQTLFGAAGLAEVEVEAIVVPTKFANFDDYWAPFLGGQGPAPAYAMSLAEADRARLEDALRERLRTNSHGSIELTARAWAVRGINRRQ